MDIRRLKAAYLANPDNAMNAAAYKRELLRQNHPSYIFTYNNKDHIASRIIHEFHNKEYNLHTAIFETFSGKYFFFVNSISSAQRLGQTKTWQADGYKAKHLPYPPSRQNEVNLNPTIMLKDWYLIPRRFQTPRSRLRTIRNATVDEMEQEIELLLNPPETLENGIIPADWLDFVVGQRAYQMPGGLELVVIKSDGRVIHLYEQTGNDNDEIEIEKVYGYSIDYNNPRRRFYSIYPIDVSFGKQLYSSWVDAFKELWSIFGADKTWQEMMLIYLCATQEFSSVVLKNKDNDNLSRFIDADSKCAVKEIPYEAIVGIQLLKEYSTA